MNVAITCSSNPALPLSLRKSAKFRLMDLDTFESECETERKSSELEASLSKVIHRRRPASHSNQVHLMVTDSEDVPKCTGRRRPASLQHRRSPACSSPRVCLQSLHPSTETGDLRHSRSRCVLHLDLDFILDKDRYVFSGVPSS